MPVKVKRRRRRRNNGPVRKNGGTLTLALLVDVESKDSSIKDAIESMGETVEHARGYGTIRKAEVDVGLMTFPL